MAIIELEFICPVCRTEKTLPIPKSPILEGKENLTPIYIQRGLVCSHEFQALIDKDFTIQRYQIIDFV